MPLFYKVKIHRVIKNKGNPKNLTEEIQIPVTIVDGTIKKAGNFGRMDCRIVPIGGQGEITADYHKLTIVRD